MRTKSTSERDVVTVTDVEVLHDHVVRLRFNDDCAGNVDLGPELWGSVFEPVADDYETFRQVRVDLGTIVWPNGADLAPELLHGKVAPTCGTGRRQASER